MPARQPVLYLKLLLGTVEAPLGLIASLHQQLEDVAAAATRRIAVAVTV